MARTFPIATALSICHNRLLLDFPTYRFHLTYLVGREGNPLSLWEVAEARRKVADHILKSHPSLADFPPPDKTDSGNAGKYVRGVAKRLGMEELELAPCRTKLVERTLSEALNA
jgi:hypothetical protein